MGDFTLEREREREPLNGILSMTDWKDRGRGVETKGEKEEKERGVEKGAKYLFMRERLEKSNCWWRKAAGALSTQ